MVVVFCSGFQDTGFLDVVLAIPVTYCIDHAGLELRDSPTPMLGLKACANPGLSPCSVTVVLKIMPGL